MLQKCNTLWHIIMLDQRSPTFFSLSCPLAAHFHKLYPSYSNILIYIQQDATLHCLFYLETALHVSGGTITHNQELKQMYLQHLVFTPPTAHSNQFQLFTMTADSNNGVTNTICCRYSCLSS